MTTTLDFSVPHVLRNEAEYRAAVREIDALLKLRAPAGSRDDERLSFLSLLVEAYEDDHEPPMPNVSPHELVDFMLDQKGMTRADLAPYMGGRGRVSDFFTGRRPQLSTNQIRALREALGIPADLLLGSGS